MARIKLIIQWIYDQFIYPLFATDNAHQRAADRATRHLQDK